MTREVKTPKIVRRYGYKPLFAKFYKNDAHASVEATTTRVIKNNSSSTTLKVKAIQSNTVAHYLEKKAENVKPASKLQKSESKQLSEFARTMSSWFKTRPIENANNVSQTFNDLFQTTTSGLKSFTHLLSGFTALPIVGTVLQGLVTLFKSITIIFNNEASTGTKVFAIAFDTVILTLAALGVGFASASFSFIFGLAAAGMGLVGAGIGVFNAIKSWYQTKTSLEQLKILKETATLEGTANPEKLAALTTDIKKLSIKTAKAKAEIFNRFTGAALAAAGVISATIVVVAVLTAPISLSVVGLAAAAIGLSAAVIGLFHGITNHYFQQRDKDAQAKQKAHNPYPTSNASIVEEHHNNAVIGNQQIEKISLAHTETDDQLSIASHKTALLDLINLLASHDIHVPHTNKTELANMAIENLKLVFQDQVEKAQAKTLHKVFESINSTRPDLTKHYLQFLQDAGVSKQKLDKLAAVSENSTITSCLMKRPNDIEINDEIYNSVYATAGKNFH